VGFAWAYCADAPDPFYAERCRRDEIDVPASGMQERVPRPDSGRQHIEHELTTLWLTRLGQIKHFQCTVRRACSESEHVIPPVLVLLR